MPNLTDMVRAARMDKGGRGANAAKTAPLTPRRAEADARQRLAELHDWVIQTLFGVGLTLQAAAATLGDEAMWQRLGDAADNLAGVVRELRDYSYVSM